MSRDFSYMIEDLFRAFGPVIILLIYGAILFFGGRWLWRRIRGGHAVRGETLMPAGDPMRYALASAVLKGSLYRRRIIDAARNPFLASAPELGLDVPTLVSAARQMERAERRWQWIFFSLVYFVFLDPIVSGFLGIGVWSLLLMPVRAMDLDWETQRSIYRAIGWLNIAMFLSVFGLAIYKRWQARFRDVKPFRRAEYDAEAIRTKYGQAEGVEAGFDPKKSNTVVYGTSYPFVGLGVPIDAWQVAIDLTRPAEKTDTVDQIGPDDVYQSINSAVARLNLPGVETSDVAFVNGTESSDISNVQTDRFDSPSHEIDAQAIDRWRGDPNAPGRVYRWIRIPSSQGEVCQSYFVRCVQMGQTLFLEAVQTFLPPVDRTYREVDFIRKLGFFGIIQWSVMAVILSPLTIVSNLVGVFGQVREFVSNIFGGPVARERREIKLNPAYNYGAQETVRERIMAPDYAVYFQRADGNQFNKALDQQVLNAVSDLLDAAGIDATAFGKQATIIQESTVNITSKEGGKVIIGGNASVGGVMSRITGRGGTRTPAKSN